MDLIVQLIITMLICGFVYWVWLQLSPAIGQFVAQPFMGIINALVLILIGAIVLFYGIIPLLKTLPALLPAIR